MLTKNRKFMVMKNTIINYDVIMDIMKKLAEIQKKIFSNEVQFNLRLL